MLVAYSVRNQSDHWIEVLPPQVEISSPGAREEVKKKAKKQVVLAEQVPVDGFRVSGRRLAPGQRIDGVVTFARPFAAGVGKLGRRAPSPSRALCGSRQLTTTSRLSGARQISSQGAFPWLA